MKRKSFHDVPDINNKTGESVNLLPEEVERARALWEDADFMLRLVDLIFMGEPDRLPPS